MICLSDDAMKIYVVANVMNVGSFYNSFIEIYEFDIKIYLEDGVRAIHNLATISENIQNIELPKC